MLIKTEKKWEEKYSTNICKKKTMKLFATKTGTQNGSKRKMKMRGVWIDDKPLVINFID